MKEPFHTHTVSGLCESNAMQNYDFVKITWNIPTKVSFSAGMADSEDSIENPQGEGSATLAKSKARPNEEELHLRKKRKAAMDKISKIASDMGLFSRAVVVLVGTDGETLSFGNPPTVQENITKKGFMQGLLDLVLKPATLEERAQTIAFYGNPPSPKPALLAMNTNTLRLLLRAMQFDALQAEYKKLGEEKTPEHMQNLWGCCVHMGEYLHEDDRGMVSESKFEGKNTSNGRYQAMNISEDILNQRETMWKTGADEHADDPAYTTFEEILGKPIAKMSRAMLMVALWIHLEHTHPGDCISPHARHHCMPVNSHTHTHTHTRKHAYLLVHACVQRMSVHARVTA